MPLFLIATNDGESLAQSCRYRRPSVKRSAFGVQRSALDVQRSTFRAVKTRFRFSPTRTRICSKLESRDYIDESRSRFPVHRAHGRSHDVGDKRVKRDASPTAPPNVERRTLNAKVQGLLQASARGLPSPSLLPAGRTPVDHRPEVERCHSGLERRVLALKTPLPWLRLSVPW